MPNPFDTGIRMTVVRTPGRTRCDVDEFVLCPTNARADEWQRLAETEARDHLATAKRLVEGEVEVASLSAALGRANHVAWEARQERDAAHAELVAERDAHHATCDALALERAEVAGLRARLAECERERDDLRSQFDEHRSFCDEMTESLVDSIIDASTTALERDAAIQRAAAAEADTVARIVAWLERLGYMSAVHVALVRAGAWRDKAAP